MQCVQGNLPIGAYTPGGVAMAEHTLGHARESQQALDDVIAKHAQAHAQPVGFRLA